MTNGTALPPSWRRRHRSKLLQIVGCSPHALLPPSPPPLPHQTVPIAVDPLGDGGGYVLPDTASISELRERIRERGRRKSFFLN